MNNKTVKEFNIKIKLRGDNVYDLYLDGEEIECWTYEKTKEGSKKPDWWGNGQELRDEWDFDEDDE